jgi:hypothetical protein
VGIETEGKKRGRGVERGFIGLVKKGLKILLGYFDQ